MKSRGIDFYLVPAADFHGSEYVGDYFKVREFFSGFDGSSGSLLVWREGAGLWTDGRYFIQAGRQLAGTGITLFRMGEDGVPEIEAFLKQEMRQGQTLGLDGRVISAREGRRYEECLYGRDGRQQKECLKQEDGLEYEARRKGKGGSLACEQDLAETIWRDRPPLPAGKVSILPERLAGRSVEEKLADVRKKCREEGAESLFLTKLDDLMWLFNIRGCDVAYNPVALSYGYITQDEAFLFLRNRALDGGGGDCLGEAPPDEGGIGYFRKHAVTVKDYGEILPFLQTLPGGQDILVDDRYCSYLLYRRLREGGGRGPNRLIERPNPTEFLKAVKNPTELANMERVVLQDSVAVTKFIYWLKKQMQKTGNGGEVLTESSAADYLERLRGQIPGFLGLSFPTISAYKENAAMMHYEAVPETAAVLKPEGLLLVDSGGQYLGGTTDVTRTIVLGAVSEEEKKHYTLTAAGLLQLAAGKWPRGCTGRNLDILAREPLWQEGLDYQCGTGHGVGYLLNVHEGPQSLRWRVSKDQPEAVLEEGMVVTDEPGVYVEGSHGIRIENILAVKKDVRNENGQFLSFDTLTYVPLDPEAIEERYLTAPQEALLAAYQRRVYEKLSPFLTEEERAWLREIVKSP
jgi:Xaa-Pro aminopeptidase